MDLHAQSSFMTQKVARIGANVLGDFLKIPLRPGSTANPALDHRSQITITGAWQGRIDVGASHNLGERIAATMFRKEQDQLAEDDINDALAEVTNIIAGNIKAILPGPSQLSLPNTVSEQAEAEEPEIQVRLFDDHDGMLSISLKANAS
ncbi:MAG: chemotaxis protein CheX [Alcanivorax sp.]|nr:chemotaxis protein CheX [Alcanivorax sp.]